MVHVHLQEDPAKPLGYALPEEGFCDLSESVAGLNSDEQRLAIINRLLAYQRKHAWDHERGDDMFHGAAIVRSNKGRWYLCANIHPQNPELTRSCAEASGVAEMMQHEGPDAEVAELWFMGGKANYKKGQPIMGNEGQRNTPCGSCLDVIWNHKLKVSGETLVHMLPLNDGSWTLIPGKVGTEKAPNLARNEVLTRTIGELFPHVSNMLDDTKGRAKETMKQGYEWLKNGDGWKAMHRAMSQQELIYLEALDHDDADVNLRKTAINKALMHAAKDYYQAAEKKPHALSVAIVRTEDGQYFIGKYSRGSIAATAAAELEAIGVATSSNPRNKVSDVFVVNFSEAQLKELSEAKPGDPVTIPNPDGETRERFKKHAPKNGKAAEMRNFLRNAEGAHMHVFLPNNPDTNRFDPQRDVITYRMCDLLPYAYDNPKSTPCGHN